MLLDPVIDYPTEVVRLLSHVFKRDPIKIDSFLFFLHYNVTVSLLIVASLLVTTGLYLGDPIECISDSSVRDVIDSYCWVHSTFTVIESESETDHNYSEFEPHPGVKASKPDSSNQRFHSYYQWVCYLLFIQALIFYIPRLLWKSWEGGRMKELVDHGNTFYSTSYANAKESDVGSNFLKYFSNASGEHNFYFGKLVFCEILNLLLCIGQLLVTNAFLGLDMTKLGIKDVTNLFTASGSHILSRDDVLAQIFPKVSKCSLKTFGPSGSIQQHDALCVLTFNVINEKIYLFFWLWLCILIGLSCISLMYRILTMLSAKLRTFLIKSSTQSKYINSFAILGTRLKTGDWFILYQMRKNIDPVRFTSIVKALQTRLSEKHLD